jgi:hypothetical protein
MAGRPSLGVRRQVNVRFPPELVTQIDQARGIISRDAWMERACRLALKPIAVFQDRELKQEVHRHDFSMPVRTEFKDGERIRIKRCYCGEEGVA